MTTVARASVPVDVKWTSGKTNIATQFLIFYLKKTKLKLMQSRHYLTTFRLHTVH